MGLLDVILGSAMGGGMSASSGGAPAQGADPLDGLLGAILGGHPAVQRHAEQSGMSIDDVLASIASAGGAAGGPSQAPAGQGGMGDILGQILGAAIRGQSQAPQTPQPAATGQGEIGDVLGQILGAAIAGQTQTRNTPAPTPPGHSEIGDILGQIVGAAIGGQARNPQMPPAPSTAGGLGPLGSVLEAVIGGGTGGADLKALGAGVLANAFLAPIVTKLSDKLGLSPAVAAAIVAFAVRAIVAGATQQRATPQAQPSGGINDILQSLGEGQRIDRKTIKQFGLADQLASETGIDPATAARGLQAVFEEFSGPMSASAGQPDLSDLLAKWAPK